MSRQFDTEQTPPHCPEQEAGTSRGRERYEGRSEAKTLRDEPGEHWAKGRTGAEGRHDAAEAGTGVAGALHDLGRQRGDGDAG